MKKLIALLLCLIMTLSLVACGNPNTENPGPSETPSDSQPVDQPTDEPTDEPSEAPVVAEPLPSNPLFYWGFEDATNLTAVTQVEKAADSINDGATYDIGVSDHPVLIAEGQGAVGNALYLDGKYGVKLDNLAALTDDSYTVSFWLNADRLSTYGPVLQMGRNMGDAGDDRTVTWLNVTKSTWGTNSADLFPIVWNRNSSIGTDINADGVWPWISAGDDMEHGKREWCLVTLVVDGNRYVADDSMERIGTKYYLNGNLVFDASPEFMFYQGVSPEILIGDGVEGYIGINYWDTIYKGFIDELYIYDEALTAGQVLSLYEGGNPPAEPVAPEYEGAEEPEPEPEPLTAAPVDPNAIDTLGTPDRVLGWWSDNTDGYALADGQTLTMKLNNYSCGQAFYHNFVVGLCNSEIKTDLLANGDNYPGYAEYAVFRADAWGWTPTANPYGTYTPDWTDFNVWLQLMTDADVTITMTRTGGTVAGTMVFVGADGTTMNETFELVDIMAAGDACYVFIGGEGAYIELLSVE